MDETQSRPAGLDEEHRRAAQQALARIETLLQGSERIDEATREKLLAAARDLERALGEVADSDPARARSVANAAELAVHEAAQDEPQQAVVERAIALLDEVARPLEQRAPRVVEIVGQIAQLLANLGI
ncbi:MAG: hypothetical protein D6776_11960 [Planctomycetota bacterium]|nr:MAG: hypothetical protein D6776_11960 [Planctomycetota bacterium]